MEEGSRTQAMQIDRISESTLQSLIDKAIKEFACPHYGRLLPARPIAPKEESSSLKIGFQEVISTPFFGHYHGATYSSYIEALEKSPDMPARHFHGVMHMLRTALFSQIFYQIFNPRSTPKQKYLVAMSAAYHDSARQDEGRDRWDELSAWNLRRFLMNHNPIELDEDSKVIEKKVITDKEIKDCYQALASKDPKDGCFTSDVQKAVHDADCIEINRCLHSPFDFDPSKLEVSKVLPKSKLDQLIREFQRFIQETETLSIKSHFEYNSLSPYAELVSYLLNPENNFRLLSSYFLATNSPAHAAEGLLRGAGAPSSDGS
jgi:hypothetical protein